MLYLGTKSTPPSILFYKTLQIRSGIPREIFHLKVMFQPICTLIAPKKSLVFCYAKCKKIISFPLICWLEVGQSPNCFQGHEVILDVTLGDTGEAVCHIWRQGAWLHSLELWMQHTCCRMCRQVGQFPCFPWHNSQETDQRLEANKHKIKYNSSSFALSILYKWHEGENIFKLSSHVKEKDNEEQVGSKNVLETLNYPKCMNICLCDKYLWR